jgi:hypothetical protein
MTMAKIMGSGLPTAKEVTDLLAEIAEDMALDYGCNGDHDSEVVSNAFGQFAEKLRRVFDDQV